MCTGDDNFKVIEVASDGIGPSNPITVSSGHTGVKWQLSESHGLVFSHIYFYQSSGDKRDNNVYSPLYFNDPQIVRRTDEIAICVGFNSRRVSGENLYYMIEYMNFNSPGPTWDPQLIIEPRGAFK